MTRLAIPPAPVSETTAEQATGGHFESSDAWFSVLAATCLDPGDRPCRVVLPGATLAMRERTARCGPVAVRTLASLTTCYSTRYAVEGVGADEIAAWVRSLRRERPRIHRLVFEALPSPDAVGVLMAGLRRGGLMVESFQHFGAWYERVEDGFDAYWAARDSRLRNSVTRRERALQRGAGCDVRVFTALPDAAEAVAAYQTVYDASWKEPEPYPAFIPALISALLAHGAGFVGVLAIDGRPAAAQIWIVGGERATLFKLAHDERRKQCSPGSLLTKLLLERVLHGTAVREVDFGRGDDPYKRQWVSARRQVWGVAAYDPATPVGAALATVNLLPRVLRRRGR